MIKGFFFRHPFPGRNAIIVVKGEKRMVIYIQEDTGSVLLSLLHQMLAEGWRDIVSVAVAFFCTCTVTILAINRKKPRK